MYICLLVIPSHYTYAYTHINFNDSSSKVHNSSEKCITLSKKIEFQRLTSVLNRKFTL